MANHWILKTEPSTYRFEDLVRDGSTVWDGVRNNLALKHIGQMRRGDRALVYHSGKEKALVGLARIASAPYPDPSARDPKLLVVDLESEGPLPRPVALKEIKAETSLKDLALVRMPRLSVMPATSRHWEQLLAMARR